ncbi:hypothetical protein PR048_030103 [Dryococelus australis]|uniref:Uncharacterized protein n=1 Tax=Dryococelus australis TaxID=614101 RepID=A0ABQ9G802_9NEOP|nr:hypothetical protein PR048_030103 [Dryococelus australis]
MIGPKLENCMANEEKSSKLDDDKNDDVLGKRKFLNVNDNVENSKISPSKRLCFDRDSKHTKPGSASKTLEIIVVNGTWETSRQVPSVIAEMHTVKLNNVEDSAAPSEKSVMNCNEISSQEISHGNVHCNVNDEYINNKDDINTSSDDNKSLSWLINFKVDTLFRNVESQGFGDEDFCAGNVALTSITSSQKKQSCVTTPKNTKVVFQSSKDQPNPEPVVSQSFTDVREKKPPFTYTELIEQALDEKGELTVSEIYQWIS